MRKLLICAASVLAMTAMASASEPACPPLTVALPTATNYAVSNTACGVVEPLPGGPLPGQCLYCPGESLRLLNQTQPICIVTMHTVETRTIARHLVNGKCVPLVAAHRPASFPAPIQAGPPPLQVAPAPPRSAPAPAPPRVAPPRIAPPALRAAPMPRTAPPPPPAPHSVPSRPLSP